MPKPRNSQHSRRWLGGAALLCLALLTGCESVGDFFDSDKKTPLPGKRLSVLQYEQQLTADSDLAGLAVTLTAPFANSQWPQAGGYPDHNMGNVALGTDLHEVWRADAGAGSSSARRLVSAPVAADNRVFVLDADGELRAFSLDKGKRLWAVDTRPEGESSDALTGGLALAGDRVYVTSGYASVAAYDVVTGKELWRQRISAPSRAAPTVSQDRVYVVTIENRLLTLDANNGTVLWDHSGLSEGAGLLGAASPATDGTLLVVGYSSGEVYGLRADNGQLVWQDSLAAVRRLGAMAGLSDIHALPVIADGQVFVISHSGRMLALDARSGLRLWQRKIGGTTTPVVAGDFLFLLSNSNELLAITKRDGHIRWVTRLPRYENEEKHEDPINWTSPLLAGGRLILTGSNDTMLELDVTDGSIKVTRDLPSSVEIDPIVVGGTLLVLDESGRLTAYR